MTLIFHMKLTLKHYIALISFGIFLSLSFSIWFFWDDYAAKQIAAFQKTDDWTQWEQRIPEGESAIHLRSNDPQIPIQLIPGILVRTDASDNLLLKHRYGKVAYIYESSTKTISQSSESDWQKASGEITNCYDQIGGDFNFKVVYESYPVYRVSYNGVAIKTYGKYAFSAKESPTHTRAAIVSGYGPLKKSSTGFIGLGGNDPVVHGRRYVQIFDLNENKFIGEPVRIERAAEEYDFNLCWSKDEKYVVAYKPYENFSVIETIIDK